MTSSLPQRFFFIVLTCSSVVVAAGWASGQTPAPAGLKVDKEKKTVTIECRIAPRKLPNLSEVYPIEVIAAWAAPKGQKAHETVVTTEIKPSELHQALVSLGLKPGKPAKGEGAAAAGPEVKLFLDLPGPGGIAKRMPIERALVDKKTGKTMPALKWVFTGSVEKQPDPAKPERIYAADATGTFVAIFPVTDECVLQSSLTMKDEPLIKLDTNVKVLPEAGVAAQLVVVVP